MDALRPSLRDERGLTLTELLVTLALLVLMAAVALPQFAGMKTRAYNAQALSNLEMLAKAEGRRRVGEGSYASCDGATACAMTFPELRINPGVAISAVADEDGFVATASHASGDERYVWDSSLGGLEIADGGGSPPDPDPAPGPDPDPAPAPDPDPAPAPDPDPAPDGPGKPGKPDKPVKPDKPGKPGGGNGRGNG